MLPAAIQPSPHALPLEQVLQHDASAPLNTAKTARRRRNKDLVFIVDDFNVLMFDIFCGYNIPSFPIFRGRNRLHCISEVFLTNDL